MAYHEMGLLLNTHRERVRIAFHIIRRMCS
jgi:hypothetical protein